MWNTCLINSTSSPATSAIIGSALASIQSERWCKPSCKVRCTLLSSCLLAGHVLFGAHDSTHIHSICKMYMYGNFFTAYHTQFTCTDTCTIVHAQCTMLPYVCHDSCGRGMRTQKVKFKVQCISIVIVHGTQSKLRSPSRIRLCHGYHRMWNVGSLSRDCGLIGSWIAKSFSKVPAFQSALKLAARIC